jgi:hypothetical protein
MSLDPLPVLDQQMRSSVQAHEGAGFEVDLQQFTQTVGFAQPGMGGPFRPRLGHAPDEVADDRRLLRSSQLQLP